jgi:hypothetical protein
VLVAVAVLVSVELGLRLLGVPAAGLYDGDPASVWWLKPGLERDLPGPAPDSRFQLRTNELGLRGDPPPADGPWTLALGCSTTLGWGVEEDEAWPAQLQAILGEPVVNGGQPGWSTHQALAVADRWLALGPTRVILGFLVRDAQRALQPDHYARPTPWIWRTHLVRLIAGLMGRREGALPGGSMRRVPVNRYVDNLHRLEGAAAPAEVWLLAFPQREPSWEYRAALERDFAPLIAPTLPEQAFFEDDPIHLNPEGHRLLAQAVARALAGGAPPEPGGEPTGSD